MKTVKQQIEHLKSMSEYYANESASYAKAAEWFAEHGSKLDGFEVNHYGRFIEVQTPTREELMRVLKAFPGKWEKSVNGLKPDTLDYSLPQDGDRPTIDCKSAPPPPSCKIVEEIVEVPAQPARQEIRKIVKCFPGVEQATDESVEMAAI